MSLKAILERETRGHSTVMLYPEVPGYTVGILLPDSYALSAHLLSVLQGLPGVGVAVR